MVQDLLSVQTDVGFSPCGYPSLSLVVPSQGLQSANESWWAGGATMGDLARIP